MKKKLRQAPQHAHVYMTIMLISSTRRSRLPCCRYSGSASHTPNLEVTSSFEAADARVAASTARTAAGQPGTARSALAVTIE